MSDPEQKVENARMSLGNIIMRFLERSSGDPACLIGADECLTAIDALVLVARQAGRVKVLEEAVIAAKGESGLACGAEVVRIERLLDAARKAGEERDGTDDPTAR